MWKIKTPEIILSSYIRVEWWLLCFSHIFTSHVVGISLASSAELSLQNRPFCSTKFPLEKNAVIQISSQSWQNQHKHCVSVRSQTRVAVEDPCVRCLLAAQGADLKWKWQREKEASFTVGYMENQWLNQKETPSPSTQVYPFGHGTLDGKEINCQTHLLQESPWFAVTSPAAVLAGQSGTCSLSYTQTVTSSCAKAEEEGVVCWGGPGVWLKNRYCSYFKKPVGRVWPVFCSPLACFCFWEHGARCMFWGQWLEGRTGYCYSVRFELVYLKIEVNPSFVEINHPSTELPQFFGEIQALSWPN